MTDMNKLLQKYNKMKLMGMDTSEIKAIIDRKFQRSKHVVGDIYRYYHLLFMKHSDGSYEYLCRDDEFEGLKYNYRDGRMEEKVEVECTEWGY